MFEVHGATPNFRTALAAQLAELIPEAVADGKVDIAKLKELLGDDAANENERFGLFWPGKKRALRAAQTPTTATLKPDFARSKDWDATQNVFIEGDNLEVLKLLQKHYHNKIKLIYIDPPYNTGKDFVYPDNYVEGLQTYLEWTKQVNEEGKKISSNSESEGRYHSNWLNMMYPRLKLARNLLTDDGVIFISINDNEAENLKKICNEIFGENNYLVTMYVQVRYPGKTLAEKNDYQKLIEQVLVYQRKKFKPIKQVEDYSIDGFCWNIKELKNGKREIIGGRQVDIFLPGEYTISKTEPSLSELKETWATGSVLKVNASGKFFGTYLAPRKDIDGLGILYKVYGIGEDGLGYRYFTGPQRLSATKGKFFSGIPLQRRSELVAGGSIKEMPVLNFYDFADAFGNCRHEGGVDFRSGKKPIEFLRTIIEMSVSGKENATVLDFFAGSASTAHAVMQLNAEDDGQRCFIMVQLPEPPPEDSDARRAEFKTIADISRKRIELAGEKIKADSPLTTQTLDTGFRAYQLTDTNFAKWRVGSDITPDKLQEELFRMRDSAADEATQDDLLTEILLKMGFPLTAKITSTEIAGLPVRWVSTDKGEHLVLAYLDEHTKPTLEQLRELAAADPVRLIVLEDAFHGDDELKTNLAQLCKSRNIELWTA
ncbi:MAG: site-specific DNA-methyltransferase [Betaproteobacteria bacterium]|nr:site-specific DNA-methyltransferase [Betaproteobacteria bacterium]